MYEIIFYHSQNGESKIEIYLDDLKKRAVLSKSDRINWEKTLAYLTALSQYGTRIGEPFVKHLEGDLWELRPLRNRIFFFCWKDESIVLLHQFVKKSQKTPARELEQAKREMRDFLKRGSRK